MDELKFTHDFGNRKVVYFGTRPYVYSGGVHEPKELNANTYLAKVCNYLDIIIPNYEYNSVLVSFYANGDQFIPKHSDSENCIEETSDIVTVSLGATRTLRISDSTTGQIIKDVELKHGAVSVMTKHSQSKYKHEIVRDSSCLHPRISVTFRLIKPPVPPKIEIKKPDSGTRNLCSASFISSSSFGYVPFPDTSNATLKLRKNTLSSQKDTNHIRTPQPADQHQHVRSTKGTALFISSSMFRYLDEEKLSSDQLTAKKLFYPGANAEVMMNKLTNDLSSVTTPPQNIYIMCGTNNVDKIYYGSHDLHPSVKSIEKIIDLVKHTFPLAEIHMIGILPRALPGRNDVVNELNNQIKTLCHSKSMDFMDTALMFKFRSGNRREMFFNPSSRYIQDNCHLNRKGVVRLGKFLKYWAHKHVLDYTQAKNIP